MDYFQILCTLHAVTIRKSNNRNLNGSPCDDSMIVPTIKLFYLQINISLIISKKRPILAKLKQDLNRLI